MSESNLPVLPRPVYQAALFALREAQATLTPGSAIWRCADELASGHAYAAGCAGGYWAIVPTPDDYRAAAEHLAALPTWEGRQTTARDIAATIARGRAQVQP